MLKIHFERYLPEEVVIWVRFNDGAKPTNLSSPVLRRGCGTAYPPCFQADIAGAITIITEQLTMTSSIGAWINPALRLPETLESPCGRCWTPMASTTGCTYGLSTIVYSPNGSTLSCASMRVTRRPSLLYARTSIAVIS